MGQQQTIPYKEYQKDYTMVSKNQNDELLIRHKQTGKQYMLRKLICKSEQELEERIKILNRRKKIKSQHLLTIVDFKPINDDRICGNTMYVSLLMEYPFESLYYETLHRLSYCQGSQRNSSVRVSPLYFQQHQLWSILYSCALGLQTLFSNDMAHQSITKSLIFIDKEGVVKIGDPILLATRTNYDRVIQIIQKERGTEESSATSSSNNFYSNDKNLSYLKRLKRIKQPLTDQKNSCQQTSRQSSKQQFSLVQKQIIISPELISLCKDHQYYYFDKEKSDIYVLGAMMIQLALLENLASYSSSQIKFKNDLNELFGPKSKLKEKYSAPFLELVENMVSIDPKKRPTMSELVQRIQDFSIQENSQSDRNSLKKHTIYQENHNQNSNLLNHYVFNDQSNQKVQKFTHYNSDKNNIQKSKPLIGLVPSYYPQTYSAEISKTFNLNLNNPVNLNTTQNSHPFPSFSVTKDSANYLLQNKNETTENYHESAVRPIFSKKLPVQIKYVESPLIIPVSNVRGKKDQNKNMNPNTLTPFYNLKLTESNEQNHEKDFQKQSFVKKKITIVGAENIKEEHLFTKVNEDKKNLERFSMNNFGKIQIQNTFSNNLSSSLQKNILINGGNNASNLNSNNNSNSVSFPTSVNTSMLPTPRFQNPLHCQSLFKMNQLSKPLFPFSHESQSNQVSFNWSITNALDKNAFGSLPSKPITYQNSFTQQLKLGSNIKSNQPIYDAKKRGFSIGNDYSVSNKKSTEKEVQPYYTNSSVGYTLPKYRPQSSSSVAKKSVTQQKVRSASVKNILSDSSDNKRVTKLINSIQQTESFLQKDELSPNNTKNLQHSNSSSAINVIPQYVSEKNETHSNSSQNTVKKETSINKNSSARKKYNFYKKEISQNLQKIDSLNPITQIKIQRSPSGFFEKQDKKASQGRNSVHQVRYNSQTHSVYVEEKLQNGSIYRGFKLNNKRHGNGVLIFTDSGFYEGQFHQDRMQGQGKLYYNQKDLAYEGQFLQNCFHGYGTLYNNHSQQIKGNFDFANMANIKNYWLKYDGYFKEDQKSGKCHVYLTNGEQFEGFCQNNTFQGSGRFKTLDGVYIEGVWKNNILVQILDQRYPSK